jgi:hypothetical protein
MMPVGSGQPHRYFFVHMMKTAGSAFRRRLINHFGEAAVYPARDLDRSHPVKLYLSADDLRARLVARGAEIEAITGHFPLRTVEELDGRFTTLTLLRDPVERTLSYLRQERQGPPVARFLARGLEPRPQTAGRSLAEIYDECRGLAQTNNHMTRMLSLRPAEFIDSMLTPTELSRGHLARAKEGLAGIDVFGVQERFKEFCDAVSARFGWDLGTGEVVHASAPAEAPQTLRARIAEDNALDVELYEFAKLVLAARDQRRNLIAARVEQ